MRLTKKKLRYLIKDERKAAKEYRRLGLPSIAKDEAKHKRILLRKLHRDKRGVLYTYLVLILLLAAGIFFSFLFMNLIEKIQEAMNPLLGQDQWATTAHYDAFYYAATFVTNIWTYIIGFIILIASYWVYIYSSRRGAGYE